jgi:hypothetical protein
MQGSAMYRATLKYAFSPIDPKGSEFLTKAERKRLCKSLAKYNEHRLGEQESIMQAANDLDDDGQ